MFKTRSDMEVIIWAKKIMKEHGLGHWDFKINGRFKNTLGQCSYGKKLIQIRRNHVEEDTYECVLDTLMHEIAHALVGHAAGHGTTWMRKAIELGAKPSPTKHRVRDTALMESNDEEVCVLLLKRIDSEVFQCIISEKMYNEIQTGKRNIKNMHIRGRKAMTKGRLICRRISAKEYAKMVAV